MAELVWVTDPHFNFLGTTPHPEFGRGPGVKRFSSPYVFGHHIKDKHPNAAGVIITGDIAESHNICHCVASFQRGYQGKVYFILGNHDYYGGSIEATNKQVLAFVRSQQTSENIVWLRHAGVIEITHDTALVGNEGWYDGRAADPMKSNILMNDFMNIKEFRLQHQQVIAEKIRELAAHWAKEAEIQLRAACEKYKHVIFATHVPPFPDATWHKGQTSNSDWLPWMCNLTMGDMLIEVAYEFPDTSIVTLCGHTHSPGQVVMAPNLRVLTGESEYWYPQVAGVLRVPEDLQPAVR